MNLTAFQKAQIRHVVATARNIRALHLELYHQQLETQKQRNKRKDNLFKLKAEVDFENSLMRSYSREAREKIAREGAARIPACEREVKEAESNLASIVEHMKEIEPTMRAADQLRDAMLQAIENGDSDFREELGGQPGSTVDIGPVPTRGAV